MLLDSLHPNPKTPGVHHTLKRRILTAYENILSDKSQSVRDADNAVAQALYHMTGKLPKTDVKDLPPLGNGNPTDGDDNPTFDEVMESITPVDGGFDLSTGTQDLDTRLEGKFSVLLQENPGLAIELLKGWLEADEVMEATIEHAIQAEVHRLQNISAPEKKQSEKQSLYAPLSSDPNYINRATISQGHRRDLHSLCKNWKDSQHFTHIGIRLDEDEIPEVYYHVGGQTDNVVESTLPLTVFIKWLNCQFPRPIKPEQFKTSAQFEHFVRSVAIDEVPLNGCTVSVEANVIA